MDLGDLEATAAAVTDDSPPLLETGDLVWGKVRSHPWWPGELLSLEIAPPAAISAQIPGNLLVAFFGDATFSWLDPSSDLLPFAPFFPIKSRRISSSDAAAKGFRRAVGEAVQEISRRAALSISCPCRSSFSLVSSAGGRFFFSVDVPGHGAGVYSAEQIQRARAGFSPAATAGFARRMGADFDLQRPPPRSSPSVEWIQLVTTVLVFRMAVFADICFGEAFGMFEEESSRVSPEIDEISAGTHL